MKTIWRHLTACIIMLAVGFSAYAEDYPTQPIRLIVPMAPGGGVDIASRVIGKTLSEKLGQPVVIENRPGAGGAVAAGFVARAKPDGYTLFMADTGQLSVNPSLYRNLPYDPDTKFTPVTEAVSAPLFLAVNSKLPVRTFDEFVSYVRKNPGIIFGTTGVGSVHNLGMHLLESSMGLSFVHVPYKGSSQTTTALVSGEIQATLSALPSLQSYVAAGNVRLLAVASEQRTVLMPELPTIQESGDANYDITVNIGFVLPPNTSPLIAKLLREKIVNTLGIKEVKDKLLSLGLVPIGNTPEEYGKNIKNNTQKYSKLIDASGARQE